MGLFDSLKKGLEKTRNSLMGSIEQLFGAYDEVDDDFYEELEETLVLSDMGMETSMRLVEEIRKEAMQRRLKRPDEVKGPDINFLFYLFKSRILYQIRS